MYEDEKGFITFGLLEDGLYIEEIYVEPEFRKTKTASQYADLVADVAQGLGLKKLYGSVVPSLDGSHYRMLVLLGYGFKIYKAQDNLIWFIKEI